jgi:hypothetical protein
VFLKELISLTPAAKEKFTWQLEKARKPIKRSQRVGTQFVTNKQTILIVKYSAAYIIIGRYFSVELKSIRIINK